MGMFGRGPVIVGTVVVIFGLAVFLWKSVLLALPVTPSDSAGPWRVELSVTARGNSRGSVRAGLPTTSARQVIFDESNSPDRLLFAIRTEGYQRTGIWSGRLRGVHNLLYGFRVDLTKAPPVEIPEGLLPPPPAEIVSQYGRESTDFPAASPEVKALLETLAPAAEPAARLRLLFGFVTDEVGKTNHGSEDALLTLAAREGRPEGRIRLLVALLRAAGIPARPVGGLQLREGSDPRPVLWAEAWLGDLWVPLAPNDAQMGSAPASTVVLRRGDFVLVEATGVEAVGHRWRGLREHLRPEELYAMMVPADPLLARLSLYRLPVETQSALRALLLLPLGALMVAIFRNVIGVPTFGTFMPVLIALALRTTALLPGLAIVGAVIAIGLLGRIGLDRLRLLLVPRLAILLCFVVLLVTGLALLGRGADTRDFFGGVLLPMVILTMLIERVSVTLEEEGTRAVLVKAGWSVSAAVAVYGIFQSVGAQHIMFSFPELVFVVIGTLVWIGGYTGYRLSDLIRFRGLAEGERQ
ncbi:MAG: 7TM domain-containing protein [Deltaproteobacteria bacterium]|nr:7TM domain-containing protein [Deltaproteobacteria bacterium]